MTAHGTIAVGSQAPAFKATAVVDASLKEVSLSSYTDASHWVILSFFPRAWSLVCPTEIKAFSIRLEEFLYSRSCAVVFCSTDSEYALKAWNATPESQGGLENVHIPLLSDSSHKMCKDYGVLVEDAGAAQRALFIIDPKGTVRAITINDANIGRGVDETQRVLDALMFKDEFGEGCPADWHKGDKGIDYDNEDRVDEFQFQKKTWSEWARPKLSRAFSAQSTRSISSVASGTAPGVRVGTAAKPFRRPSMASGYHSPGMLSPMSGAGARLELAMEEAMAAQRLENMNASMHNRDAHVGIAN